MIEVYTDGSCLGNPGKGGWAFLAVQDKRKIEKSGYEINTTNNRMELKAAINAIHFFKSSSEMKIYTDSNYLKNGITIWINNWLKNDWRNSQNQIIKNIDLWKELNYLNSLKKIEWYWVKAHAKNEMNNRVDYLARKAAGSFK